MICLLIFNSKYKYQSGNLIAEIKGKSIKIYIRYNESNAILPKCRKNKIIGLRVPGAILGLNLRFGGRFSLSIGMAVGTIKILEVPAGELVTANHFLPHGSEYTFLCLFLINDTFFFLFTCLLTIL